MGRIKEGKLKIELQSDLCAGSGYSYAGIVDSDSCYDEYGMPYIPARRIRGCMRETAETLLYSIYDEHKVEALFGYRGNDHSSDFVIGNAYVEEYYEVRSDL
jgi:CRISPR-associated protein Csx10